MHISAKLAAATHALIAKWDTPQATSGEALDVFTGDIYQTLNAPAFTTQDRQYANHHLRILSGQYGILKPLDIIQPYRLEIGYRLRPPHCKNLYDFWSDNIAVTLKDADFIVNIASEEYFKAVGPHLGSTRVISPLFLTKQASGIAPTFVAIHAKWARGAFARWMVQQRIDNPAQLHLFSELGYVYDIDSSTSDIPVFVRPA
jgi:cytoplasmic iron level regulating protein YaaA (DUF328/UPF0246 family)